MNIELNIKPPETRNFLNKVKVLSNIKSFYIFTEIYMASCKTAFCQYKEMPFMMNYLGEDIDFDNMRCDCQDVSDKKTGPIFRWTFIAKNKQGKELILFYDETSFSCIKKTILAPRFDIYEEIYHKMLYFTSKKFMETEYPELIKFNKSLALIPYMHFSKTHFDKDNISNLYSYIKVIGHIANDLDIYNSNIKNGDEFYREVRKVMDFLNSLYNISEKSSEELYLWSSVEFVILFKIYAKEFIIDIEDANDLMDLKMRIDNHINKFIDKYLSNYNILENTSIDRKEIIKNYEKKVYNK